jgi:hypothetical protein
MEILSKLVTRQVHSLNIQINNLIILALCFTIEDLIISIIMEQLIFYMYLLSAGVENAKTVGWLFEMCVSDTASFF